MHHFIVFIKHILHAVKNSLLHLIRYLGVLPRIGIVGNAHPSHTIRIFPISSKLVLQRIPPLPVSSPFYLFRFSIKFLPFYSYVLSLERKAVYENLLEWSFQKHHRLESQATPSWTMKWRSFPNILTYPLTNCLEKGEA
jgi:hypothetical protein